MKVLAIFSLLFVFVATARAVPLLVTRTDDRNATCLTNDCSLREAIFTAHLSPVADTITFASNVKTITLTSELIIQGDSVSALNDLSIVGPGADALTINAGTGTNRIFSIGSFSTFLVSGMTLTGGNGHGFFVDGTGGAIGENGNADVTIDGVLFTGNSITGAFFGGGAVGFVGQTGSSLTILNSTFSNNSSINGNAGGLYIFGTSSVIVTNSTFTGNYASQHAGAILLNTDQSTLLLRNVTVANNTGTVAGGGIEVAFGATCDIGNTISAQNVSNIGPDVVGTFANSGNNLIGIAGGGFVDGVNGDQVGTAVAPLNPLLGGLQNNGGAIPTRGLQQGSPAINTGSNALVGVLNFDERGPGFPRINGGTVDKGAYEFLSSLTTHRTIDFDEDGKTDISIFRPSANQWWYYRSTDGGNNAFTFGTSTDALVPGDYTGDNKTDIAFWRPSTGEWFILRSQNFTFFSFPFGTPGDLTAPADYDGDGRTDAAVFRPSTVTWYIRRSSDSGTTIQGFGSNGDVPAPADYDGDGKSDIAIYRPSLGQWWWLRSLDGIIPAVTFGVSTDKTVQGDYTGDGKADIAFFRPSTGEWFVLRSEDFSYYSVPFGLSTDQAAPGDYDGDGRNDVAVFRPSNSTWYITKSTGGTTIQAFGTAGDRAVPNVFVR